MLLKTILFFTHYVIYLRSLVWSWILAYSRPLALAFHRHTLAKIHSDAKTLDKLPIHLGILVVEDEVSFKDLANIILWCMAMGISYVSIYDRNGKFKTLLNHVSVATTNNLDYLKIINGLTLLLPPYNLMYNLRPCETNPANEQTI